MEKGGLNLYAQIGNGLLNGVDYLGLSRNCCPPPKVRASDGQCCKEIRIDPQTGKERCIKATMDEKERGGSFIIDRCKEFRDLLNALNAAGHILDTATHAARERLREATRADALAGLNWAGETAFGLIPGISWPTKWGTALSTVWTFKGYFEESAASISAAQLRRQRHSEWATLQKALGQQERNYSRLKSQYER
jgi:hypothetical protein